MSQPKRRKAPNQPEDPYAALRGKVCVVTGSQGMFGLSLCRALLAAGAAEVRGFDRVAPRPHSPQEIGDSSTLEASRRRRRSRSPSGSPGGGGDRRRGSVVDHGVDARVRHFCGDIMSSPELRAAIRGADAVFHAASYGMSGVEMLDQRQTRAVNVSGTKHVLDCCNSEHVKCLIYTSTYNTVFGGQRVDMGDESMGYYPLEEHADEYSRTKALAEQLVLGANDAAAPNGLRTLALRSAAIYGEGERRHFPRIIKTMRRGMYLFTIGDPSNLCDWVHVDNLVHAHLLAAGVVLPTADTVRAETKRPPNAYGRAYFISDGSPINNFEFLAPICELVGISRPPLRLPTSFAYHLAHLLEFAYWLMKTATLGAVRVPPPMLSRAEVLKVGVSHTFSIEGATAALGYRPVVSAKEGQRRLLADLAQRFPRQPLWWEGRAAQLLVLVAMLAMGLAMVLVLSGKWVKNAPNAM